MAVVCYIVPYSLRSGEVMAVSLMKYRLHQQHDNNGLCRCMVVWYPINHGVERSLFNPSSINKR
jgi:hypothetical protein